MKVTSNIIYILYNILSNLTYLNAQNLLEHGIIFTLATQETFRIEEETFRKESSCQFALTLLNMAETETPEEFMTNHEGDLNTRTTCVSP